MTDLKYGDRLTIELTPGLEMEIADILQNWIISLSKAKEFDFEVEQFHTMKCIIKTIAEHQVEPE